MSTSSILRRSLIVVSMALVVPAALAQNAIRVFSPVNVQPSPANAGYGANANTFNSSTLNLTCSASPITAVLSSAANSNGNVLVDNQITVTATSGTTTTGPVNVCRGGVSDETPDGQPSPNCFTTSYEGPASAGQLDNVDPDTLVSTGGVAPIDISSSLQPGPVQLEINFVDYGGVFASSTLYLNTNCSLNGVTGPATISGNPIPQTNPTPAQLTQNFSFNTTTGQQVGFVYDLSQAQAAGSLSIMDGTAPGTNDVPVDPTKFQSTLVEGTSFATSICLIHTGELLNGQPACKLFTLECTVGSGTAQSGALCPVSSLPNEVFQDVFDGPSFTLSDINTPGGLTFHEGVGFLMASEGWIGGPCSFDPASGLQDLPCPQNLLANFSGPGLYIATGQTSHPNSTFIPVAQVPEDFTTVTVANQQAGGWINSSTANVTLSSQPPVLAGTNLPGAATFVASPIQSITYGISSVNSVPTPSSPVSNDTVVQNTIPCPSPSNPLDPLATVFATPTQTLNNLADGNYLLHYYAQDCAGTEELKFTQDASASWSTSYYTFAINVDTIAPVVASGPVLSPAPGNSGSYTVGETVTATYSCTDEHSGVVRCGTQTFSPNTAPLNTGPITSPVDTSSPGVKTYTVTAIDAAGNQSSASVSYTVASAYDTSIQLTLSQTTVTYPQGTNVVIRVTPTNGHTPTGTVQLFDGTTPLQSARLQSGAAYLYIQGLNVGVHQLSATYAGDAFNPGGSSAPVALTVNPVPVQLTTACWNATFAYGVDYNCGIYLSSNAGPPNGVVTYQYDGGSPVTVPLRFGVALFTISRPQVGTHSVVIGYAAQTNYAAANPSTVHFTVTPAPVVVQLTPSSWYVTGGNLMLNVTIQSWSAGPPNGVGTVSFYEDGQLLMTVPVGANGTASMTVPSSSLSNGNHTFRANYSGGTNYSAGSSSVTVGVAKR